MSRSARSPTGSRTTSGTTTARVVGPSCGSSSTPGPSNEEPDQSGVAHFLEHMLFNGTEQFPENELIDVLRGFGAEFGADINAFTQLRRDRLPAHRRHRRRRGRGDRARRADPVAVGRDPRPDRRRAGARRGARRVARFGPELAGPGVRRHRAAVPRRHRLRGARPDRHVGGDRVDDARASPTLLRRSGTDPTTRRSSSSATSTSTTSSRRSSSASSRCRRGGSRRRSRTWHSSPTPNRRSRSTPIPTSRRRSSR